MNGAQLYDLIPVFCGAFFVVYGVLMMVCPKVILKKEFRDDADKISKTKKNGIIVIVCGMVVMALQLV